MLRSSLHRRHFVARPKNVSIPTGLSLLPLVQGSVPPDLSPPLFCSLRFRRGGSIPFSNEYSSSPTIPPPNFGLVRHGHFATLVFRSPSEPLPALVGEARSPRPPSWGRGRARRWRHFAIATSRRWRLRAHLLGRRCVCAAFRSRYVVLAWHGRDEGFERRGKTAKRPAWTAWRRRQRGGLGVLSVVLCFVRGDGVKRKRIGTATNDGNVDRTHRKRIRKMRKTVGPTRGEGDETTATTTCVEKQAS